MTVSRRTFKRLIGPLLLALIVACTNQQLVENLETAIDFGKTLTDAMRAKEPDNQKVEKVSQWVSRVERFKGNYEAATTPEEKVKLGPALASITDEFSSEILAATNIHPVAVAGIDAFLRRVVRQFQKDVKDASPAQVITATVTAKALSVDLDDSAARLSKYLESPQVTVKK